MRENMKLEEYKFGFADAETEFSRDKNIFEYSFYDPKSNVDKLMNGHKFMIVGRKGVGKTAILSKIKFECEQDSNLHSFSLKLNDFEYSTFSKTSIEKNTIGTQKYKDSWDFILLMGILKILYEKFNHIENDEIISLLSFLEELGFSNLKLQDYKRDISNLAKIKRGVNIPGLGLTFEKEFGYEPNSFLEKLSAINSKILNVINNSYNGNNKIYILIDGLDDLLRYKKEQLDILTSLLRSINYLNDKFFEKAVGYKIIISIREDILNKVTDPDLNKMKRDGSLKVDWTQRPNDLKKIVALRMQYSGLSEKEAFRQLDQLFPPKVKRKNGWEYILDHTLYKPRDILQFMITCQDEFPNYSIFYFSKLNTVLKTYSSEYFINEMKDELSGFIDDKIINALPHVFKSIGSNNFSQQEFFNNFKEQSINDDLKESDIRVLLIALYDAGYIGQLIPNHGGKDSVNFKYKNTNTQVDFSKKFIIHHGLQIGLGVRL